jgi:hypothetical protein
MYLKYSICATNASLSRTQHNLDKAAKALINKVNLHKAKMQQE